MNLLDASTLSDSATVPARKIRVRLPKSVASSLYLILAGALFFAMAPQSGIVSVVTLLLSMLITATLPGASFVRHLFRSPGLFQTVILGTVLGLGLLAVGGLLAQITTIAEIRWVPSILGVVAWVVPSRQANTKLELPPRFPRLGIWGSLAALITFLPSLWTVVKSQPLAWEGWYLLHHDLLFQIALVGEASSRAPSEFPWVGEPLSYPWFFHSAMGVWASVTGTPAAAIVLQAWPILYVGLMPAVVSISAWNLTQRRAVAFAAPLVFTLTHGLVFTFGLYQDYPLHQVSPTRDFAHLFILLSVLGLSKVLGSTRLQPSTRWWFAAMCLSAFVAAGSKGSSFPLLLGGLCGAICGLAISRKFRPSHIATFAGFIAITLLAFLVAVPVRGPNDSVDIAPLTFLGLESKFEVASMATSVGVLFVAILGIWFINGRSASHAWLNSSIIAGVSLAGLAGVSMLGHPGLSQLYFWQGAQPLFAISLAWAGTLFYHDHRWKAIVGALLIFVLGHLLWALYPRPALVGASVVLLATVTALTLSWLDTSQDERPQSWLGATATIVSSAVFLSLAPQVIQLPVPYPGGGVAEPLSPGAIHSSQLAAYEFIRSNSYPLDKVISNKHCYHGSLEGKDCDGRWFAAAAFAERRVQVEGWAYTPQGSDLTWVRERIETNDEFITNPSLSAKQELLSNGVAFVYVDKNEPFSHDLDEFGTLVFEGEWALVYSLDEKW